jgi:hypothetical protein
MIAPITTVHNENDIQQEGDYIYLKYVKLVVDTI